MAIWGLEVLYRFRGSNPSYEDRQDKKINLLDEPKVSSESDSFGVRVSYFHQRWSRQVWRKILGNICTEFSPTLNDAAIGTSDELLNLCFDRKVLQMYEIEDKAKSKWSRGDLKLFRRFFPRLWIKEWIWKTWREQIRNLLQMFGNWIFFSTADEIMCRVSRWEMEIVFKTVHGWILLAY